MGLSAQYTSRAREVEIYALLDESGTPRYVGKANDAKKRLAGHLRDSRRRDTPLYRWIRKCSAQGFAPTIKVLETCAESDWPEREVQWISEFRGKYKLLNVAAGGDEPYCSYETRAANARRATATRCDTPEKKRLYQSKKMLCDALRRGHVSQETQEKLRRIALRDPANFGVFLKWL